MVSGSSQITYSGLTGIPSGILSGSAQIASFGIFATTGSNQFNGNQSITGSLTVSGQVVAQTLNVQQVTSSIVYSSGSNIFGNSVSNVQQFTGSLQVSGSSHNILGNVGIGSTGTPVAELQVGKSSDVVIAMSNSSSVTSGNRGGLAWYNSSNSTVANIRAVAITDNVGTQLEFYTRPAAGSLTQRLTLNSSGNLGLGVTPSSWGSGWTALQVGARSSFYSDSPKNTLMGNNLFYDGVDNKYIESAAAARFYIENTGTFIWQNAPSGTAGNAISFTQAMTLDANGRLGIGTTSPGYRLDIGGTASSTLGFTSTGATAYSEIYFNRNTSTTMAYIGVGVNSTVSSNGDEFVIQNNLSAGNIVFRTNGGAGATERMRITSGGNIGIGTTSPTNLITLQKLGSASTTPGIDFRGTLSLGGVYNDLDYNSGRIYGTFDSSVYASARVTIATPTGVGTFQDVLTVKDKNVGIGTTSPSYTLDVQSNVTSEPFAQARFLNTNSSGLEYGGILVNGDKQAHIRFLTGTSTWGGGGAKQWQIRSGIGNNVDALSIYSWTNGADVIYFNSSGNVGIGTTSPTQKLVVEGSEAILSVVDNRSFATGVGGALYLFGNYRSVGDVTVAGYIKGSKVNSTDGDYGFDLVFGTQTYTGGVSEKMRITSAGILKSLPTYNNTTGVAANVQIDSNGFFARSTSSLKYKTDITNYTKGLNEVLGLRPVFYKGKTDGDTQFAGLIAEEVHELGLTEFVQYAPDGSPDALSYQNMVALAFKAIQEQQSQIESLKAEIQTLKQ